jgi:transposase-like protein
MGSGSKKREGARTLRKSTPEERRQAVEAFQKSGLTQALFARQWRVNPITFSGWVAQAGARSPGERRGRKSLLVRGGCMAHARRTVFEAKALDPERALILLALIRRLYDHEEEIQAAPRARRGRSVMRSRWPC